MADLRSTLLCLPASVTARLNLECHFINEISEIILPKNVVPIPRSSIPLMIEDLIHDAEPEDGLDAEKAHRFLSLSITTLLHRIPALKSSLSEVFSSVIPYDVSQHSQTVAQRISDNRIHLEQSLEVVDNEVSSGQNIGWPTSLEDAAAWIDLLSDIHNLMLSSESQTIREVLLSNNNYYLRSLIRYFLSVTERHPQQMLLKIFSTLALRDGDFLKDLLDSMLPMEIGQRLLQEQDKELRNQLALVLLLLLSQGERLPASHNAFFDETFIIGTLRTIEQFKDMDHELTSDLCAAIIVSLNLIFDDPKESTVVAAISREPTLANDLFMKIFHFLNKDVDLTQIYQEKRSTPNAMLKLLVDLYSCQDTANLFYVNDTQLLLDVVIRQILNIKSGEELRWEYISLLQMILRNGSYDEHRYKCAEIQHTLTSMMNNSEENEADVSMATEILREFPAPFPS